MTPLLKSKYKPRPNYIFMADPTFAFEAIGTSWQIDIYQKLSDEEKTSLLSKITTRIALFDQIYSRFRADSLVTEMAKKAGAYTLPDDAAPMMAVYEVMYRLTGGLMTPLIGQVLADAGYDANYSLQPKELHQPPAWDDVLEYRFPTLTLKQPALLDFGAAGKGYLIDIISNIIREAGISAFCVDAGGDIFYANTEPKTLSIGLENPSNVQQIIGVAQLPPGQSICGSAGNRRAWGTFTHIINPKTLTSPKNILAVWVMAKTTLLADALTTALFFVPAAQLQTTFAFEYILVYADFSLEKSPGFPAELFT